MGGCQNHGPFLGTLRCRIIIGIRKSTIILTTIHMSQTWSHKFVWACEASRKSCVEVLYRSQAVGTFLGTTIAKVHFNQHPKESPASRSKCNLLVLQLNMSGITLRIQVYIRCLHGALKSVNIIYSGLFGSLYTPLSSKFLLFQTLSAELCM